MKRVLAMIAVFGLSALMAAYVGLAPIASPTDSPAARRILSLLDEAAAHAIALGGRNAAIIAFLLLGIVLVLLVALTIGEGPVDRKAAKSRRPDEASPAYAAPGPVWRPEPMSQEDRIASLRRRAIGDSAEAAGPDAGNGPRPVVLIRKPRERDRDWFDDRSWLGGLPRLGEAAWPCDTGGTPLPFAAQIDLAELAAACPESPLPHTGSLAFFLGTGAVVAVPEGHWDFAEPPQNLPPAFDEGGFSLPTKANRLSRHFFPFWPVEPVALDLPEVLRGPGDAAHRQETETVMTDLLAPHAAPRNGPFGAEGSPYLWWHGVNHLADQLHVAIEEAKRPVALRRDSVRQAEEAVAAIEADGGPDDARLEAAREHLAQRQADLAAIEAQRDGIPDMIAALEQFVAGRDPWQQLTAEEYGLIEEFLAELHANCSEVVRYNAPLTLADLAALSLRTMVTDAPEALAAMPDDQLDRINREYRLPIRHQHQMFGPGAGRQSTEHAQAGEILLLQLAYDDMMEWRWGELGMFQFWISPQDAAAGRWENARLLFEEA
ncbi:DUF1963 domain-containing protein [Novosphingobium malaysiense]|uniref:DUF1963 domain-containing protein n=1 Tax=Novosphingobium malaysiense TaxID=1348853 RepID=A0A0B1ZPZ7_9SPHN|nr:DUF1963 domain-containing protein [Novosphingobium malaysiense]KHK92636.1 hypothetical protein LK12_07685 [Novosphingobium malaysiense]